MRKFNRSLWEFKQPFSIQDLPAWPCPCCELGELSLEIDSFCFKKSSKSKIESSRFDNFISVVSIFEALANESLQSLKYCERGQFNAFMQCSSCREFVAVSGAAQIWNKDDLSPKIIPFFFSPTLPVVPVRSFYPKKIQEELQNASAQFLLKPWLAGNSIRRLVEIFVDDSLGEPSRCSLHQRIVRLGEQYSSLKKALMSLKCLGNTASHEGDVCKNDILDAFYILSFFLEEHYGQNQEREAVLAVVNSLTEKHGGKG